MMKPRIRWGAASAVAACLLVAPSSAGAQRILERLDLSRPLTYYIAEGSANSGYRKEDRALAQWALEAWGKQLDPAAVMVPAAEADAAVRVYWVDAEAGLYGEMRARILDGRFAADVFVHPDTDALGRDIAQMARLDSLFRDTIVYLTCVHELGHAFGLPHTRAYADIMYSFQYGGDFVAYFMRFRDQLKAREDIRKASAFSVADRSKFRALHPRPTGR